MAMSGDDPRWQSVDSLLYEGWLMKAIKEYRELTGEGLKQAKEAVQARQAELRRRNPSGFATKTKSGCLGLVLVALASAGATPNTSGGQLDRLKAIKERVRAAGVQRQPSLPV